MRKAILILVLIAVAFASHSSFFWGKKDKKAAECPLELNKEYPTPTEAQEIAKVTFMSEIGLNNTCSNATVCPRDAHPKSHGCVRAYYIVEKDIPAELQAGIFKNLGQQYKAIIRFSNGNPKVQSDFLPDSRGMAIKVLGVPGEKVLPDEKDAQTQDFISANCPHFFLKDSSDYIGFMLAAKDGFEAILKFFIGQGKWREANLLRKFILTFPGNVATTTYFSITPYRLGGVTVKYQYKPVDCKTGEEIQDSYMGFSENYLRDRLTDTLNKTDVCFDVSAQKQLNACVEQIEDPRDIWETPFTKVARIVIPRQENPADPKQLSFCENLSFTPWHTLEEHRPLGNINRNRLPVYQRISQIRHARNGVARKEPTDWQ